MATFTTRFLGCKVSFADAQAVRERLLADGHVEVDDGGEIAVVNTCCVTHEAVSKTRQAASRAARSARAVYLTGCATNLDGALDGLPSNVVVTRRTGEEAAEAIAGDVGAIGCIQAEHRLERVRAFVKIQDGCSFACNFCVIPLVRGGTRSRTAAAVLAEIEKRVGQGHREIVLTGVNLGCFRDRVAGLSLPRLLREAGSIDGLELLRLSSIEVNHVDAELVAALRETPTVAPHLHVPLQSGDDAVLAAMGRRYTSGAYLAKVAPLAGELNLTADVIVGFPTEDEAAFTNTMRVVEAAGITRVHVFPYSPRPGTRTAAADTVPAGVKRDRSARLRALSAELCARRWKTKLGTRERILVDRPGRGYGADYTPWLVAGEIGSFVTATAAEISEEGVHGRG